MSKSHRDQLAEYIEDQKYARGRIGIGEVLADETAHRRPEDLGYPLLGLGVGILLLDAIFSIQVIWARKFDFEIVLPLIAFGAFGLILLISGIVMLPKHRQKKIHHKNNK